MVKKANDTPDTPTITRIKATDTSTKKPKPARKQPKTSHTPRKKGMFRKLGGYFKGAWQELKQVRWPTRRNTWLMTLALILFCIFFAVIVFSLDAGFQYLFKLMIGK